MSPPPDKWTSADIATEVENAKAVFRQTRASEPVQAWIDEVGKRKAEFALLLDNHNLASPSELTPTDLPAIVRAKLLDALRYVPGPPISADDLSVVAEVKSLSAKRLAERPEDAARLLETILRSADPYRFKWLHDKREPTAEERKDAIVASALLHAAQRLATDRRNLAKRIQEQSVRDMLVSAGFECRPVPKKITNYAHFPPAGVVSAGECLFGPTRADIIARLWDDRVIALECKVSNSAVNSYKRVLETTLQKKDAWNKVFGEANIVPSAVLAGAYSPANLTTAQSNGLTLFWSHRLDDLRTFTESTRP
jgi:hypothetical protein